MSLHRRFQFLVAAGLALLSALDFCADAAEEVIIKSGPQRVSLVELYTSEGCSSCPSAEEWMSGLRSDARLWRDFVPIAFHVDYWDRLGWKDRFAQSSFTTRQYAHSQGGTASSVYTPEFFVDGHEWRDWFGGRHLPSHSDRPGVLEVRMSSSGDLAARFFPEMKFEGGTIHVGWLGFGLASNVRRGENAGRSLHHDFVVLHYANAKLLRDADGQWRARLSTPHLDDKAGALAVWAEANNTPVQAAGGWLVSQ